ncbi:heavy metal translocating P-type ATPase [Lentzea sp. BCCO 10_0798]|uniref:Heavy metal translocating P-type ATPase n=1 Tax=Lentzea kristufekii TaxID=3095430 RepID=A0ABU4TJS7_9PSEU|nr:heavy metal translocating P-type ATPase [Lentzea sp. BCCO 10_0798]MDX8048490.1 heavy metal translocating P-type ATPase [Lentzea sp. BCCO 10_0798]
MTSTLFIDSPHRTPTPKRSLFAITEVRWAIAATALFLLGVAAKLADSAPWTWWTLLLACYVAGGWEPALAGLKALRERTLDVDLLMIVAAIGAASIGQVVDGGLLIVIFATSGALEAVLTQRTADSVRGLLDLAPQRAWLLLPDSREREVDAETLRIGDEILVRPGERIGGDGEVVDGSSEVDEASITGEPLPVPKQRGNEVFAGSLNGTGVLRVRVTREPKDSVIARIVEMVEQASATKAKTQLFIEKVEQRYSVGVVVATLALFAVPLLFGAVLEPTLLRAMTFMIVASPCALVLATMPPLLAAIANAGKRGVLVKSAVAMEQLGTVDVVAFDKTGTLTEGTPQIVGIITEQDENEMLALAAAAEQFSEHPIGRAIVAEARRRELRLPAAGDFQATPGVGVTARVSGHSVFVRRHDSQHNTAVEVVVDGRQVAVIELADEVRPSSQAAVHELTVLTGQSPVLLTGDNHAAAQRIAAAVGISEVRAGLLPQDKVQAVRKMSGNVLFVGDGVNDAPALATAHAGIALGHKGSALTVDTADAVVVGDDLRVVPAVVALARRARRVVIANLVIAGTFIVVLSAWDLFGTLPLPLGVAGHEGSTVVVALNGMRLLAFGRRPRVR